MLLNSRRVVACLSAVIGLAAVGCGSSSTKSSTGGGHTAHATARPTPVLRYVQKTVIHVPSQGPLFGDLIYADPRTNLVYFSDLPNSSVDVVDGRTYRLLTQVKGLNPPGGLVIDGFGQLWVGNGNGTVQVIQAHQPFRKLGAVAVGANTDELGYDPTDHLIAVTSPDAGTPKRPHPFVTLIDARPSGRGYRTLAKVYIGGVPGGSLEQPQWNASLGRFVESIRVAKGAPGGELAIIDPSRPKDVRVSRLHGRCEPAGLGVGLASEVLVGCTYDGRELVDLATGREIARYSGQTYCCTDEVWFDASSGRFFAAEGGAHGAPPAPQLKPQAVLVIDARTRRLLTDIPLGPQALGFHQVAALKGAETFFAPESDGIHVYRTGAAPSG